eukprot:4683564-Pyramimonas_sp.AAC.1
MSHRQLEPDTWTVGEALELDRLLRMLQVRGHDWFFLPGRRQLVLLESRDAVCCRQGPFWCSLLRGKN